MHLYFLLNSVTLFKLISDTSVIYANHYLISHGEGFLVIPEEHVPEFKKLLVAYYERDNDSIIRKFLKENCWRNF